MNLLELFLGKATQQHVDTARYARPAPIVSARMSESRAELMQAISIVSDAIDLEPSLKGREVRAIKRALRKL